MAETLHHLGNVARDQNRREEAKSAYGEALTLRRALAQKNPEAYRPVVAEAPADLAALELQGHQLEGAAEEALSLYEACAKQEPEAFLPALARAKELLANLQGLQAP